jgi:hypothetical protein
MSYKKSVEAGVLNPKLFSNLNKRLTSLATRHKEKTLCLKTTSSISFETNSKTTMEES